MMSIGGNAKSQRTLLTPFAYDPAPSRHHDDTLDQDRLLQLILALL